MAARATTPVKTIEFVGPPRRLVAVGDIPLIEDVPELSGPLTKLLPPGRQALRVRNGGRRAAALSLRLAPETPAGDYKGKLVAGKSAYQVLARVLPETGASVLVGGLDFVGKLGTRAKATLAIANTGNTELRLPRAFPIALFDDDGLESAFAASYAKPRKTVDDFFATFHDRLRASHSGIIKLAVSRGYGAHAPGTSFSAEFTLNLTQPLKTGHRYHGVASTDFAEFPITVSVINGAVR